MASPREYREHLYRLRTHPEDGEPAVVDRRDSFLTVYLSMLPFLGAEWLLERIVVGVPHGLLFPVGYLLFWAFYYTYYKPGYLEERLTSPSHWNVGGVFVVLMGVAIWFVKVTIVELGQVVLLRWLVGEKPKAPVLRQRDKFRRVPSPIDAQPSYREFTSSWNLNTGERTFSGARSARPTRTTTGPAPRPAATPPPLGLPMDIKAALLILGLPEKCSWEQIHRRYRELAKKYHPDLNQENTDIGRHFMRVDAAYRRLTAVREKYFAPEKMRVG